MGQVLVKALSFQLSQSSYEASPVSISIFQMRKLSTKRVKLLALGHKAESLLELMSDYAGSSLNHHTRLLPVGCEMIHLQVMTNSVDDKVNANVILLYGLLGVQT